MPCTEGFITVALQKKFQIGKGCRPSTELSPQTEAKKTTIVQHNECRDRKSYESLFLRAQVGSKRKLERCRVILCEMSKGIGRWRLMTALQMHRVVRQNCPLC